MFAWTRLVEGRLWPWFIGELGGVGGRGERELECFEFVRVVWPRFVPCLLHTPSWMRGHVR